MTNNDFHLNLTCNNTCSLTRLTLTIVNTIADSGATSTYFRTIYVDNNKVVTSTPVTITQTNGDH